MRYKFKPMTDGKTERMPGKHVRDSVRAQCRDKRLVRNRSSSLKKLEGRLGRKVREQVMRDQEAEGSPAANKCMAII